MAFIVELWESIFTPGTTPALLKATHASFILLLLSLLSLIYYTRSIHFVNLFVIAGFLYGSVIWFVNELKHTKLQNNEELLEEQKKEETKEEEKKEEDKVEVVIEKPAGISTGTQHKSPIKKRKA
ncbi:CIC11C00000004391 [Sungouiella intermedia]|uniref:CIC11C00000004391 n=1 Tax=Sungouiella intermedia TaxID=45354 RepID=A0A1L0BW28_9ASCO|nr:CIC11C00000004391 [[Candida] intermedia]